MILEKIAVHTQKRVKALYEINSLEAIKKKALAIKSENAFAFENALKVNDIAFICEVKKASPSKGIISEDFPYLEIAMDYEKAGANAISVLTEPEFFKGDNRYLTEIKGVVNIPCLRKDFIIDSYQIYESKCIGTDAILLICTLLDTQTIKEYIKIADELGISCLVEAHTEKEIYSALEANARIIGVNNRDLNTFEVDIENSINLRKLVPKNITFISESGIKTASDIQALRNHNINAVLIGETLMKSQNKSEEIARLRGR
jgi:indole-3-glycerol phosphate synthase